MRRGGRIGAELFVALVLRRSEGLLILERGAKIPGGRGTEREENGFRMREESDEIKDDRR